MKDTNRQVGRFGETEAAGYLMSEGHTVLARNWRRSRCEIDLITLDCRGVHFVEVKTRFSTDVDPLANITYVKKRNMVKAALDFLESPDCVNLQGQELFFDVITITLEGEGMNLKYYPEAFVPIYI